MYKKNKVLKKQIKKLKVKTHSIPENLDQVGKQ